MAGKGCDTVRRIPHDIIFPSVNPIQTAAFPLRTLESILLRQKCAAACDSSAIVYCVTIEGTVQVFPLYWVLSLSIDFSRLKLSFIPDYYKKVMEIYHVM
jgi:hypothetical protein